MAILMEYIWTPLVGAFGYLWLHLHKVDKRVQVCETQIDTITDIAEAASVSRKEIYDKVDATRIESTKQVETIRKEQREDFKEIRDLIAGIGK